MNNTKTPYRRLRQAACAAAALMLAVALAGCIKVETDLTLDQDRVNGHMIMAVDKEFLAFMEQFGEDADPDDVLDDLTDSDFDDVEGVTAEPWEDDTFIGTRLILDNVPLEEFDSGSDDSLGITFDPDTGTYEVTGFWDMSDADGFDDEFDDDLADDMGFDLPPGLLDGMLNTFDIRISITFPGEVLEHNGDLSGNTVSWDLAFGDSTELHAVALAAGGDSAGAPAGEAAGPDDPAVPGAATGGSSSTGTALLVALAVLVLAAVTGVSFWLVRRSRRPAGPAATAPATATTVAAPTIASPTATPGDAAAPTVTPPQVMPPTTAAPTEPIPPADPPTAAPGTGQQ